MAYGEAVALSDVGMTVEAGSIVTVVGTNGAGKTTLVNTLAGMLRPRAGEIVFKGRNLAQAAAHRVCEHGIAISPEGRRLFTGMSVYDNLMLGAYPAHARRSARQTLDWVLSIFPRLHERRQQFAGTLSGGEQQMVAIGRALMAKPDLLLLDEPSLGLAPIIVANIFQVIRDINAAGVTILLVEQNVNKALGVAQKSYVLDQGRVVMAGTPGELLADDALRAAYLGTL